MWTAAERLQFIVRFAQMDLDALRPGDWLNLREDFLTFFGRRGQSEPLASRGGILTIPLEPPLPGEYSEENFRALQAEVRHILSGLMPPTAGEISMISMGMTDIRARYAFLNHVRQSKHGGWHLLCAQGPTRDMFLLTLFFLLNQEPLDRIMRCPECQTIFYRIRKQKYCTRACSNRATVRQWRQSETVKQTEADRAHKRYAKKKKREVGQGAKVLRRPRKGNADHAETPRES